MLPSGRGGGLASHRLLALSLVNSWKVLKLLSLLGGGLGRHGCTRAPLPLTGGAEDIWSRLQIKSVGGCRLCVSEAPGQPALLLLSLRLLQLSAVSLKSCVWLEGAGRD